MMEIQIFNLKDLFVNQVAGDLTIFIFLLLIMIGMAAARFRLFTVSTLALFVVSLLILSAEYPIILPIVLLIVGIFYSVIGLNRLLTR